MVPTTQTQPANWNAERQTDQAVTSAFCEWLDNHKHLNGVGANEAWNAGVEHGKNLVAVSTSTGNLPSVVAAKSERIIQSIEHFAAFIERTLDSPDYTAKKVPGLKDGPLYDASRWAVYIQKFAKELRTTLSHAQQAAPVAPQVADEKALRRMLCITYAGAKAYMDDGEASDASMHPVIDFMCDSPSVIQQKMQERTKTLAYQPQQAAPVAQGDAEQPRLTVRLTSFHESTGKRNWTAMFVRTEPWDGLIGNAGGITIERGELWNRVAYAAERARFLLGERDTEPFILDYSDDIDTPDKWKGETRLAARSQVQEGKHD